MQQSDGVSFAECWLRKAISEALLCKDRVGEKQSLYCSASRRTRLLSSKLPVFLFDQSR